MDKNKLGVIIIALSAVGFASLPIFAKIAYNYEASIGTLLFLRFSMASVLFLLIMKLSKTPWNVNKKQFLYLVGLGAAGYAMQANLYFYAISVMPVSVASLLVYTYPVMVCVLAYLVGDEKMYPQKIISLLISAIGLMLILGASIDDLRMSGIIAALGAAFIYSIYIIVSNRVLKNVHWLPSSTIVTISAAVCFLVKGLATGSIDYPINMIVLLCGLAIAVFSTVLAIGCLYAGLSMIGGSKTAIISTLEPVGTITLAAIVFREMLSKTQFLGGMLILISIVILQVSIENLRNLINKQTNKEPMDREECLQERLEVNKEEIMKCTGMKNMRV